MNKVIWKLFQLNVLAKRNLLEKFHICISIFYIYIYSNMWICIRYVLISLKDKIEINNLHVTWCFCLSFYVEWIELANIKYYRNNSIIRKDILSVKSLELLFYL